MNDWFEAEQRVERAQQLSESQRWEEALTELDAALAINPNNAMWHAHRGYILEELDRWEEAATAYESSLEGEPGDPEVSVSLGVALSRLGRFGRALEVFNDLAKAQPDFEPAYCHRIGVYAELGRHEQAEEMFYLAQELDDACPHCFYSIGISLSARGQTERAAFCWRRVLELDPDYIGVNRRLAQAYRAQGKHDEAREYYLRELREDPGNTDLLFELADLALESGDIATAGAKCAQILELDPEHVESHFALGVIWLSRAQPGKALACFERVDALSDGVPDFQDFRRREAEALLALGRFGDARDRLTKAASDDPDDASIQVLLGQCLLAMHQPGEAADAFRRVLADDVWNAKAQHLLAVCLLTMDRPDDALEHCTSALRAKADYTPAMHTAARACLRLARWREARAMVAKALQVTPSDTDLLALSNTLWKYRFRYHIRRLTAPFRVFLRLLRS